MHIGSDLNVVHPSNAQIVGNEIRNFNSAIFDFGNAAKPAIDLNGVFSALPVLARDNQVYADSDSGNGQSKNGNDSSDNGANGNNGNSGAKAAIRQSLILGRIRQNGNCRLKEIQETLPEVSERTIRYDIQRLLEQGAVERIGNGGPATYYKAAA
ncbi:MAG: DeoR family transcriptional regulator [Armatimonadota bacterium]|nr:DeoR family transcriptional regulator [Armatimonadota bacterium]